MPGSRLPSGGAVVVVVGGAAEVSGAAGAAAGPAAVGGTGVVPPAGSGPDPGGDESVGPPGSEPGIDLAASRRPLEHPVRAMSRATPTAAGERATERVGNRAAAGERPDGAAGFSCGPPGWRPTGRAWRCARPRTRNR